MFHVVLTKEIFFALKKFWASRKIACTVVMCSAVLLQKQG
jgi:hypothetical protein